MSNDLVQVDIDTALALYLKGYTHIPVLQRDGYSSDWSSMQPLYLDDVLNNLMAFASDAKRAELLNPPKVDVAKVKEEIALEFKRSLVTDDEDDDEDDDPDWTEAEPSKPVQVETIPDDDEVPEHERIPYEKPEVITVEQVAKMAEKTDTKTDKEKVADIILDIQSGERNPLKWNAREAVKLNDNGVSQRDLAELYGISVPTVNKRLKEYRSKS